MISGTEQFMKPSRLYEAGSANIIRFLLLILIIDIKRSLIQ